MLTVAVPFQAIWTRPVPQLVETPLLPPPIPVGRVVETVPL